MRSLIVLSLGGLLSVGCTGNDFHPTPPISSGHPASPDAPEAPLPMAPDALTLDKIDHHPATAQLDEADHDHMATHDHSATPMEMAPGESMESHAGHSHASPPASTPATYVCPMHPKVTASQPGNCPICGMTLRAKGGKQ